MKKNIQNLYNLLCVKGYINLQSKSKNSMNSQDIIQSTIDAWEKLNDEFSMEGDKLNNFITTYESVFLTYGMFVKGIRVSKQPYENYWHKTIGGVAGIVSMNIEILRTKRA